MAQQGSELNQLQAALSALQAALSLKLSAVPLSLDMCCDLMLLLIDVAQVSVRSFVMDSMQKRISFWLWVCRGNMLQARLAPSVAGVCLIMHGDASFGSCLTLPPPPSKPCVPCAKLRCLQPAAMCPFGCDKDWQQSPARDASSSAMPRSVACPCFSSLEEPNSSVMCRCWQACDRKQAGVRAQQRCPIAQSHWLSARSCMQPAQRLQNQSSHGLSS